MFTPVVRTFIGQRQSLAVFAHDIVLCCRHVSQRNLEVRRTRIGVSLGDYAGSRWQSSFEQFEQLEFASGLCDGQLE